MNPLRLSFKTSDTIWMAVRNNAVVQSSDPFYLLESLENWDKVGIEDNRNMRYGSLFANASSEAYSFVKDGARILRYVYYTYGISKKLQLVIETLDDSTQQYTEQIVTHVDWASFEDELLRVNVNMLEDSIVTMVKNREDIEYSIPVTGSLVKTVRIKEQHSPGRIRFITGWPVQTAAPGTLSETINVRTDLYLIYVDKASSSVNAPPDYSAVSQSPVNQGISKFTEGQIFLASGNSDNYLFKANVPLSNVKLSTSIHFGVSNGGNPITFRLQLVGNAGIIAQSTHAVAASAVVTFDLALNATVGNMNAGDVLILRIFADDGTTGPYAIDVSWDQGAIVDITFVNPNQDFTVKALPLLEVCKQLTDKLTDGQAIFQSNLLTYGKAYSQFYDLDPAKLVLLSENSIIGYSDANIRISLKTLTDALFSIMGAGFEVNVDDRNKPFLSIEEKSTYFDTKKLIAELEHVSDCKPQHASDLIFGEMKVGYKLDSYSGTGNAEDNVGRYEYNSLNDYKMPTDVDNKVYELISPIHADGLGIYNIWADYNFREKDRASRSSNDTVGDAKLFFLQITGARNGNNEDVATFAQDIIAAPYITGLIDVNDMVNPGLTPARCLYRNGKWISSMFFGQDTSVIKWLSSDLNPNLLSKITLPLNLGEWWDVQLSWLASRVYYPIYLNVKTSGIKNYAQMMKGRRQGFVRFTWQGISLEMFVIKAETTLAKPQEYSFKGILSPVINPLTLIR